jgi:hypothetical protein
MDESNVRLVVARGYGDGFRAVGCIKSQAIEISTSEKRFIELAVDAPVSSRGEAGRADRNVNCH